MDVIETLRQQAAQDQEALRARGLMIEILDEAVERLRVAGFTVGLELADCDALVVLRLDTSAYAVRQVGLPVRPAFCPGGAIPRVDLSGLAPAGKRLNEAAEGLRVAAKQAVAGALSAQAGGGGDMPSAEPAAPVAATVWTPERDAELIGLKRQGLDTASIAARLGVTQRAVQNRACRLRKSGAAMPAAAPPQEAKVWTEAKDAELLALLGEGLSGILVAERLGVTPGAVHDRRRRLRASGVDVPALPKGTGIARAIEARRVWTPELDARLIELYRSGMSDSNIAAGLGGGISVGAVSVRVGILRKAGKIEALSRRAIRAARGAQAVAEPEPEQKSEPVSAHIPADMGAQSAAVLAEISPTNVTAGISPTRVVVHKPAAVGKSTDAARFVPKPGGNLVPAMARPVLNAQAPAKLFPGMTQGDKAAVIAQHLAGLPVKGGFDAELDLELCEAVFSGKAGLAIFVTDTGIEHAKALGRFDAIVAPFREGGGKALPIEAAGLILPALRTRVAKARGAA